MSRRRLIAPSRLALGLLLAVAAPSIADARTSHGRHAARHLGIHGSGTAHTGSTGERQAGNNEHVGAASEEIDKVLDTRIKSICRGC
ncbi:MAG: hypothetical protein ACLP8B_23810 [Xanthobacteraceae bacterium]